MTTSNKTKQEERLLPIDANFEELHYQQQLLEIMRYEKLSAEEAAERAYYENLLQIRY